MTVSREEYNNLRTQLLMNNSLSNDHIKFEKLKKYYEQDISSVRSLGNVKHLKDLLELLEKRDCVSEDDITVFQEIATLLNDRQLLTKLNNLQNNVIQPPDPPVHNNRIIDESLPLSVTDRVHEKILDEIGIKWVEFARKLNVREHRLDELKSQYHDQITMCVREVLQYHARNAHSREWKPMLLEALTACRRNDLRKSVEYIFNNYS